MFLVTAPNYLPSEHSRRIGLATKLQTYYPEPMITIKIFMFLKKRKKLSKEKIKEKEECEWERDRERQRLRQRTCERDIFLSFLVQGASFTFYSFDIFPLLSVLLPRFIWSYYMPFHVRVFIRVCGSRSIIQTTINYSHNISKRVNSLVPY